MLKQRACPISLGTLATMSALDLVNASAVKRTMSMMNKHDGKNDTREGRKHDVRQIARNLSYREKEKPKS